MTPLFTIGIASYNYAAYLKKGLDAIRNQKFKSYEVLISDDHSTDDSVQMIKKYISDHPEMNIRLIENEKNLGIIENKNRLIEECRGEYLMICDADDWMTDDCLEKLAAMIEKDHPDRVLSEVAHIAPNGNIIQMEHLSDSQTKWGWNIHHGCANKVSVLKANKVRITGAPDDVYFTMEFSKYCQKVSIVKEVLYFWLVHQDSAGRKKSQFGGKQAELDNLQKNVKNQCEAVLKYVDNVVQFIDKRKAADVEKDREELRFVMLKLYYFYILFVLQKYTWKAKLWFYKAMHQVILEIDPQYLNNKYLKKNVSDPLRLYTMRIIRLCAKLERLHLMPLALTGYHIICKFKYFDQ